MSGRVERSPSPGARRRVGRRGEEGYNLIILMVLVTVMNVMVAVALPSWSKWAQREKEEELIFRGLQYAEAIRVFQTRFGRPPNTLEELVEVEPRSIRQLYPNPMTDNGRWGLLVQAPPGAGRGNQNRRGGPGQPPDQQQQQQQQQEQGEGQPPAAAGPGIFGQRGVNEGPGRAQVVPIPPGEGDEEGFGRPAQRTTGPILGVYAGVEGEGLKVFLGQTEYQSWHFTTDLLPMPVLVGGDAPAPRVTAAWVGRPFREDLQPQSGGAPTAGAAPRGRSLTGDSDRNPTRRERDSRRQRQ